jgi:hypothetical protein
MSLGAYALIVLGIVAGSLALLWPLLGAQDPGVRWAALAGAGLAALNTMLAYGLVVWSARRSTNVFLRAVLGGMVGRMGLMIAAVALSVVALGLPKVPLAISLLAYFVVFLVFELAVLHKTTSVGTAER